MNYQRIYDQLIEHRQTNPLTKNKITYTENHHIVARCLGGSNKKDNMIRLTAREHYMAHLLLYKIYQYDGYYGPKMLNAFVMMAMCKSTLQKRKVTSRMFAKYRKQFAKDKSIEQSGKGNSNFGSRWYYDPNTLENKKIMQGESVPNGWMQGTGPAYIKIYQIQNNELVSKEILNYEDIPNGWQATRLKQPVKPRRIKEQPPRKPKAVCLYNMTNTHIRHNVAPTMNFDKFSNIVKCPQCKKDDGPVLARYWYDKFIESGCKSLRSFAKSSSYNRSHVSLIKMFHKYIKEFDPASRANHS